MPKIKISTKPKPKPRSKAKRKPRSKAKPKAKQPKPFKSRAKIDTVPFVTSEQLDDPSLLRDVDVLLGRGNGIATFKGNKNFRRVVFSLKEEYNAAYRLEKAVVAELVIDRIYEKGGRFVEKLDDGTVKEVVHQRSLEKTCQCLREKEVKTPVVLTSIVACEDEDDWTEKATTIAKKKRTESRKRKGDDGPSPSSKRTAKRSNRKTTPPLKICLSDYTPNKALIQHVKKVPRVKHGFDNVKSAPAAESGAGCRSSARVQELVDQAIEKNLMQSNFADVDMTQIVPPDLTAFFSGIISLSDKSLSAVTGGKGYLGAPDLIRKDSSGPRTRGKSMAALKRVQKNPHSPTNVVFFDRNSLDSMFEPPAFRPTQSSIDFAPELDLLEDTSRQWTADGFK